MNRDFKTLIAAMSAEEKVALLTGSGLWRTASLPQHGIDDIVMTDGTYGVRYSSAQIDGGEKWSMDDFISVITQTADQANAEESAAKGAVKLYSAPRCQPPVSRTARVSPVAGISIWFIKWARRWARVPAYGRWDIVGAGYQHSPHAAGRSWL